MIFYIENNNCQFSNINFPTSYTLHGDIFRESIIKSIQALKCIKMILRKFNTIPDELESKTLNKQLKSLSESTKTIRKCIQFRAAKMQ